MPKVLAIIIVCAAFFLLGNSFTTPCYIETVTVVAKRGDCLETLIAPYYEKSNIGMCWDEYRYNQKAINAKLFKNGRMLQIGDTVKIEIYKKKE